MYRLSGPLNASPAQRRAALEGRVCTAEELAEEVARLAPGPDFSSEARSSPVVPRPGPSDLISVSGMQDSASLNADRVSVPVLISCTAPISPLWGSFADFAQADDWVIPSVNWHRPQPTRIWRVPEDWSTCLDLCVEVAKNVPWSAGMWRLTSPLRAEAVAGSRGPRSPSFAAASAVRRLYLQRLVTFRLLLEQLRAGSAMWSPFSPQPSWLGLIHRSVHGALTVSTIPALGFGTLVSLPHLATGFLASLHTSGVEHSRVFRLAAPHLHCHSGQASSADLLGPSLASRPSASS